MSSNSKKKKRLQKALLISRNICYNSKEQFNKKLTSESNPEERAQEELWGWKPKASAPAGTFKGSVKSGYPQRPTVVRRRSQEKVIAAGNKIAAVRRQAGRRSIARRIIRMACFEIKKRCSGN